MFELDLPAGNFNVTATKDGYIPRSKSWQVDADVQPGGQADISMSAELGEGEWRAVLNWGEHSEDIDIHIHFGTNKHVFWNQKSLSDAASGLSVSLDRDQRLSWGPETVTFKGVGKCTLSSGCLLYVRIENWTPLDGPLGQSKVQVSVFKGNSLKGQFRISNNNDDILTDLFVLDAREGQAAVHEAGWVEPAKIMPAELRYIRSEGDLSPTYDKVVTELRAEDGLLRQAWFAEVMNVDMQNQPVCSGIKHAGRERNCDEGSFITNLVIEASRRRRYSTGRSENAITDVTCCRGKNQPRKYGTCMRRDSWKACGQNSLGQNMGLVGFRSSASSWEKDKISLIDELVCCSLSEN